MKQWMDLYHLGKCNVRGQNYFLLNVSLLVSMGYRRTMVMSQTHNMSHQEKLGIYECFYWISQQLFTFKPLSWSLSSLFSIRCSYRVLLHFCYSGGFYWVILYNCIFDWRSEQLLRWHWSMRLLIAFAFLCGACLEECRIR